jgi:hypothetical protein
MYFESSGSVRWHLRHPARLDGLGRPVNKDFGGYFADDSPFGILDSARGACGSAELGTAKRSERGCAVRVDSSDILLEKIASSAGSTLDIPPHRCYCMGGAKESSDGLAISWNLLDNRRTTRTISCQSWRPPLSDRPLISCPCGFYPSESLGARRGLSDTADLYRREVRWMPHCQYGRRSARCRNRAELPCRGRRP